MTGRICGTGFCVPKHVMDNEELSRMVDTSDEWIRERTGIERRHIITEETTVSMASMAAENALEDAGISPEQVDLIITASISSNVILPCTACEVQKEIGAIRAACFDINAACCGFLTAYQTAQAYIAAGIYRTILVIGSESLSKLADWTDRGTCILFGDGAGAAVLRADETGVIRTLAGSDGRKGHVLGCQARTMDNFLTGRKPEPGFMTMDGQEVFKFAVKKVPEIVSQILEESGIGREQVDHYVLHQANIRILESASRRLKVPMEKIPVNIDRYGNTSAASVPILLDEMNREGRLKRGDTLVMAGFGAGLTWGAALLKW